MSIWTRILSFFRGGGSSSPSGEPAAADQPLFTMDGQDLLIRFGDRRARVKHVPVTAGDSLYLETDDVLAVGSDGITIEDLQQLAHNVPKDSRYYDLLIKIFNEYGVSMSYLPRGYAAGRGAAIDLSDHVDASDALEALTGKLWYGKYFERPEECLRITRGANRIGGSVRIDFVSRLIPNDRIDAYVANRASLDVDARSNYVDLNYKSTLPKRKRTSLAEPNGHTDDDTPGFRRLAGVMERLGIYDLGVMIPGRNGPILVGRTWLGEYADNREQTYTASSLGGKQIAWFFLDFNEAAVRAQETPERSRVEYSAKSACDRRTVASESEPMPEARPL